MKVNKFKVLVCCYAMGIAGCNKIGNTSYMDGGGDRKDDKKPGVEDSLSVAESSSNVVVSEISAIDHKKMLKDSLSGMKESADLAEEFAKKKEKDVELFIKQAEDARITADMARKAFEDSERDRRESPLPGSGTSYHKMLKDSLSGMKESADLAEEFAKKKEKDVELFIKQAEDARITADMARKAFEDSRKARQELGGGDASTSEWMTSNTEDNREKKSRMESREGGDVL